MVMSKEVFVLISKLHHAPNIIRARFGWGKTMTVGNISTGKSLSDKAKWTQNACLNDRQSVWRVWQGEMAKERGRFLQSPSVLYMDLRDVGDGRVHGCRSTHFLY